MQIILFGKMAVRVDYNYGLTIGRVENGGSVSGTAPSEIDDLM
jgi:hypothetical protein